MATSRSTPLKDLTGWILLGAAVLIGALAFFLIRGYLSSEEARLRSSILGERPEMARVVVASAALPAGTVISSANMSIGTLPPQHVSPRMIRPQQFERVDQRVLHRAMNAGEPLLADFVAGLVVERFSDLLAPGERAISFEASALQTSSGMLLPGDFVDLFVLPRARGNTESQRLLPLMERVKVLAAGEQPLRSPDQAFLPLNDRSDRRYSQITVGVPLADAERIILAKEAGTIVYLLRNAGDDMAGGLDFHDDLGSQEAGRYLYVTTGNPVGQWRSTTELAPGRGLGGPEAVMLDGNPLEQLGLATEQANDVPQR